MAQPIANLSRNTFWQGKEPRMTDLGTLLNMMPEAVLLLDRERKRILFPNSSLLTLTAFTRLELGGSELKDLIPGFPIDQLVPGEEREALLTRHNREPLPVKVEVNRLDVEADWLIIKIQPLFSEEVRLFQGDAIFLREMLNLSQLLEAETREQLLSEVLVVAKKVLKSDLVCIYQAESEFPRLKKVVSGEAGSFFPETIPSTDLIRLSKTTIWSPGKRVTTEIHRAGRIQNLALVASAPLGHKSASFGLLIAGYTEKQPKEHMLLLMDFVSNYISSNLQHLMLVNNLKKEQKDQVRLLAIRNSLGESVQEGVLVLSLDLRIAEINPSAELILGYADSEVHGQNVQNVLIATEDLMSALESAVKGIPTHDMGNISLIRRNGQLFPAKVKIIPVLSERKILAIQIFVSDMSEHEQIRVRTQQLEHRAVLGEFTAVFAHEVRNPINNISTGLQLLETRLNSDDKNLDLIQRMQSDCTRLNNLMESVLSFSRPMDIELKAVDLSFLMRRILDRWRPRMARVKVVPYFQADEDLPPVKGDQRALEQVFTNLISNAVEIMNKGGGTLAIRIRCSDEITNPPQIEVTVSDNGPGIPDEIKDHIFEPFVSKNPRGTGLGLAITKQIVTAHRGSIRASTFPGGTVFHVYLPIMDGEKSG